MRVNSRPKTVRYWERSTLFLLPEESFQQNCSSSLKSNRDINSEVTWQFKIYSFLENIKIFAL